ncbi:class I SAM-dependent methyltransferase [Rhodovulum tesquicola]|uniref:class I SAM-dependent methyltransferase n=1 Tax=Rhodovulum tesquicola TaxID=540254 RepID=UPI002096827E|nr:class I SAM-dependent methyltransferase [Rhodovulum tesquicola]MCO8146274.1 class I SAM-dependent methyltransferase [Rhodovulum tesquicola]
MTHLPLTTPLPRIASLWIGPRLSWLEQLCLKSFADAGHETTLYSYAPIDNVPEGVRTANAAEILPAGRVLRHARTGSPALHADLFRLNLLKRTDQIWVDADMYCLRPFVFDGAHVFGWEKPGRVCNAVLGLPPDSPALNGLLDFLADDHAIAPWLPPDRQARLRAAAGAGQPVPVAEQEWGLTGPAALTHFLRESGEIAHARPETVFYPVAFRKRNHLVLGRFDPERDDFTEATRGVHFWARRMKPRLQEKEGNTPRRGSFMARCIARHGIAPALAPIPPRPNTAEAEAAELDCSVFDRDDLVNIILQRSEVLADIPDAGRLVKAWSTGETRGIEAVVADRGARIARDAAAVVAREFAALRPHLDPVAPGRIADIGCGYAFFDLFAARAYGAELTLIDLEANAHRHFGFETEGAAYSDLGRARAFLIANGVDSGRIRTLNPARADPLTLPQVELAVSFLACGFHFPVDAYIAFFRDRVAPGGRILLDLRMRNFKPQARLLETLGTLCVIRESRKSARVLIERSRPA